MPEAIAFDVNLSTPLSRSGTAAFEKMPFNTVFSEVGGGYDPLLARFTAPRAGRYLFHLNMVMSANSGGPATQFYVNGTAPDSVRASLHYTAAYIGSSAIEVLNLQAGDYVEVWLQNANGQSFTVTNLHGTRFVGEFIG